MRAKHSINFDVTGTSRTKDGSPQVTILPFPRLEASLKFQARRARRENFCLCQAEGPRAKSFGASRGA
jgi:hypothetical protein